MALSPEQQEAAKQFILARGGEQICPVCSHAQFELSPLVVFAPALGAGDEPNTQINLGMGTPMVETLCRNCGYVRHFSAVVLGIYPKAAGGEAPAG